jgi:transposase
MEYMSRKGKDIDKRTVHQFPEALKKQVVKQLETGELTAAQAMEQYQIRTIETLQTWVIRFAANPELDIIARKRYNEAHRRQVALEIATGRITPKEAARANKVRLDAIKLWIKEFKPETPDIDKKLPKKLPGKASSAQASEDQFKLLQLKVIALETMIDIAEKKFDIDIRKKSGTKQ